MAEEKKTPRLGKAAREFNVASKTIVDKLKNKGFEIEDSPNSKLTPEMYEILVKEFQGDKLDKQNVEKLYGDLKSVKQDEEVKNDVPKEVKKEELKEVKKEEVAKSEPVKVVSENVEQIPEKVLKMPKVSVKVVGTINLDDSKDKKEKPAENPSGEVIVQAPQELVNQFANVDNVQDGSKKEVSESEPKAPEISNPIADKENEPLQEKKTKPNELKIIGTIDLTPKIKKPKSLKKDEKAIADLPINEEGEKQAPSKLEPIVSPKQEIQPTDNSSNTTPSAAPPKEHYATHVPQLAGPKVLGTMVIKEEQKKSPADSTNTRHIATKKDDQSEKKLDNKRKRKRIPGTKRPGVPSQGDSRSDKIKPIPPKTELSKEEIDKQIKETISKMSPVGKSKTSKHRKEKRKHIQAEIFEHEQQEVADQKILKVAEFITANELATLMNVSVNQIISTCMSIGLFVAINQRLDAETISLLADEFGFQVSFVGVDVEDEDSLNNHDNPEDLLPRHPIIAVMGHVDHGKTSLLDYIRKTNVIAGEAGGITQHIGAYEVQLPDGRKITFLDTPGHEAFTAMRARGAKVTDLCIIVIAADDSIMPQTVEAINHAQAAGVPMVFAITKIDKPTANPEKIREGLANMNILVEEWGGTYQCQEIDAKHGTNINDLLEKVLLEAELLELKANPNRSGVGTVIESSLDKGKGYVSKILVQNGTLKLGDPILAGSCYGKVKALYNERNQLVKSAIPSTPVLMLGLNGAPQAGDIFKVCASEHDARIAANKRMQLIREMGLRTQKHITLDEIGRRLAIGDFKELNIIVKGDADGSVEALTDELLKLSTEQVQVNVIHKSVGQVTDTDVMLASASNAIIVAFQVRPSPGSRKLAEQEQIDIRIYSIIYNAINEIKDAIAGMHSPEIQEKILSNLEVREVYKITKVGNIAGCMVLDGKLQRNTKIRLIRDGIVIYSGKLGSLKRFKDDVKEVVVGQECGLNIENFNDIKVGDIIEGYEEFEVKVTL